MARRASKGTTGSVNGTGRLKRVTKNMNSRRSGHGTQSRIGRTGSTKRLRTHSGRV